MLSGVGIQGVVWQQPGCQNTTAKIASSCQGTTYPAGMAPAGLGLLVPAWSTFSSPSAPRAAEPLPRPGLCLLPGVQQGAGCVFRRQDADGEPGSSPALPTLLPSPPAAVCAGRGGRTGTPEPPPSCSARLNTWAASADVRLDQLRDAPAAWGWGCCDRAVARGVLSTSLPIQQGHEALWDETGREGGPQGLSLLCLVLEQHCHPRAPRTCRQPRDSEVCSPQGHWLANVLSLPVVSSQPLGTAALCPSKPRLCSQALFLSFPSIPARCRAHGPTNRHCWLFSYSHQKL